MKKWTGMITNLTMLTQFGLSLVTPLFLCLALCWWLCDRFSVGTWIYLLGFFFGIGGGAVTAWKFGQSVLRHLSISARIISIQYFCCIIILLMLVLTSKSVSLSDGSMLRIAILTVIQGGLFYGSIYVGQVSAGIFLISEHCFFPCRGK